MKIDIKNIYGDIIYSHEEEHNSIGKTLEKAAKERADLSYADLRCMDLSRLNLAYANLTFANVSNSYLIGTNLDGANISHTKIIFGNFTGANLINAHISRANLTGSKFIGSDLTYANFAYSNLSGTNLRGAKLDGSDFTGAKYKEATFEKGLLQIYGKQWPIFIFDEHIKIGCEMHKTSEWEKFTDYEISIMDESNDTVSFWKANKEMILMLAKNHQSANDVPSVIVNAEDEK